VRYHFDQAQLHRGWQDRARNGCALFVRRFQAWRDEGFRHFMLQELDDPQIEDFLNRWHRGAYEETHQGETKRELLARAIVDSVAIRQLAGNPLLLTMMAILNRTQDLPRDRTELYEQCARLLLHQWKVELALDQELAKASLDFKDKRNLLLRVARAMQTSERGLTGNLIDENTLERTLTDGLKGIPNLGAVRQAAVQELARGWKEDPETLSREAEIRFSPF
jgi:predicted NACHT family NTPase